jgi:CHAD domain-containing protein
MISPTAWLERLQQELAAARAGDDPEGVHQMRVAAGRLRVWLELGRRRALVDDLRWLRRSASEVRDLDVLLAENSSPECASWLEEKRAASRRELVSALDDERVGALLTALVALPALSRARARRSLERFRRNALHRGAQVERDATDVTAWHGLRRSLRRLRYAREWLEEDTDEIRHFLDLLGELNNRVVEARHLAVCGASGAAESLAIVRLKIEEQRTAAAAAWSPLREKLEAE